MTALIIIGLFALIIVGAAIDPSNKKAHKDEETEYFGL